MRLRALAAFCVLAASAAAGRAETLARDAPWRWADGVYRWHYSPAGEPAWLERQGLALFREAAGEWQRCGVRIEFGGETDLFPRPGDGVNVAGWGRFPGPGMRGATYKRRAGSSLIEADVAINAENTELRALPPLLRKVIVHEFGHALGLVHSADCADVMSFGANCRLPATALPQRLASGDLAQCAQRYGPFQSVK